VPVTCGEVSTLEVRSTIVPTRSMAGGGLFDTDGALVGLFLPCGDRFAAVVPEQVDGMLTDAAALSSRLLAVYGVTVGPITPDEAAYFKAAGGVIVRDVWVGRLAEVAGLVPGDIVTALNDVPVATVDDLRPLVSKTDGGPAMLSVQRNSKNLLINMAGDLLPVTPDAEPSSVAGLLKDTPPKGVRLEGVQPGSRAAAAGLRHGDRLLRIGRAEPRDLNHALRLLDTKPPAPVFVEFERGGRRFGTLVPQAGR
jgi:S1-C subfamily serine protease